MDIGSIIFLIVAVGSMGFFYMRSAKNTGPTDTMTPRQKVTNAKTAQDFIIFDRIENDMIVLNKYQFRAVLKLEPINLPMYSAREQVSIKERFRMAMIGVRYPFSFYLPSMRNSTKRTAANIQKLAGRYLEEGNESLASYGEQLAEYINFHTSYRTPLEPGYFVVITYDALKNLAGYTDAIIYEQAITELNTRCQTLMNGLGRAELKAKRLNTDEITQLVYFAYNREVSDLVSVKDAIRKGVFSLFTTEKMPEFDGNDMDLEVVMPSDDASLLGDSNVSSAAR